MSITYLFVYGTLMPGGANYHLAAPYVSGHRPATARGLLYDLPYGYPAMIDGDGEVHGQLLELADIEAALPVLDELEDYYGPGHPDNMYERVERDVALADGQRVRAFVYLWVRVWELEDVGKLLNGGLWGES